MFQDDMLFNNCDYDIFINIWLKNQWWNNKDQTDKIKCGGSTLQDHEKQGIQPPISSQNQIDTMYIYINQRLTHIWNTHMFVDHVLGCLDILYIYISKIS